jgi:hypothetical protein
MLFLILSVIDLIAAGILVLGHFGVLTIPVAMAGVYLTVKIVFWRDIFTIIDFAAGVYCGFVALGHSGVLTWLFLVYFVYKGATGALVSASS